MQLVPYECLPDLPRKLWKRIYTAEEKAARSAYYKVRTQRMKEARPAAPYVPPTTDFERRARALANAAFNNARAVNAAPLSTTQGDRERLVQFYRDACAGVSERLSVDHIYPLGGQRYGVSGLHVQANLVVIPLTENQSKNRHPHESWTDYSNPDWSIDEAKMCIALHGARAG